MCLCTLIHKHHPAFLNHFKIFNFYNFFKLLFFFNIEKKIIEKKYVLFIFIYYFLCYKIFFQILEKQRGKKYYTIE